MNETFEEADTIDVLDEEDFEEAQTSHQDIPRNIPQKEENKDSAKENKHKRKSSDFSLTGVSKRKRSASDDAGTAYKPKIKVAGPWNRHDSITNDKSGSFVAGENIFYRESTSHKPPFVQPFIKKMFSLASNPNKCNNALKFTDRDSIRDGRAIKLTQVRKK